MLVCLGLSLDPDLGKSLKVYIFLHPGLQLVQNNVKNTEYEVETLNIKKKSLI